MENRINNVVDFKQVIRRGDVWFVRLIGEDSMQVGVRPCIIVSNNMANKYSPTISVIPLTSKVNKRMLPTHVTIEPNIENGLTRLSISLAEAQTTISKKMLLSYIGRIDEETMKKINRTIIIQNGLEDAMEM